jgi:hypothetical protein
MRLPLGDEHPGSVEEFAFRGHVNTWAGARLWFQNPSAGRVLVWCPRHYAEVNGYCRERVLVTFQRSR